MTSRFDSAQRIADTVLFEGYVLYPYRASAAKNQYRWQFGIVAPDAPRGDGEPSFAQTQVVIARAAQDVPLVLAARVRFLRPHVHNADHGGARPWLEGVPCAVDIDPIPLDEVAAPRIVPLPDAGVEARLTIAAETSGPFVKATIRLENLEPWRAAFDEDRDAMLRRSLVGAHVLLAVEGGRFESLLEPSAAAAPIAAACQNVHCWPVLVGDRSTCDLVLASPIVLYDFPVVANESRGDLCDGAEIDEILSLRILTLTEAEKREARATDPRARAILDRVDSMAASDLAALHGTLRSADFFNPSGPPPEHAHVTIDGVRIGRGSIVRLRPNRRADAMDMFLKDQQATVAGVYRDVDDRTYVAVTVDADPAASLHESFGRYFYFDPAEVEPAGERGH